MAKKILIVDDEFHIRLLLNRSLRSFRAFDVDILFAEDGDEAWELSKTAKPDLVFLDVMMPKLSGFDICEKIKSDPNLKDIYVIFLTAKGQEFDKDMGFKVGADDYVTKPFDPDDIVKKTEDVLGIKVANNDTTK